MHIIIFSCSLRKNSNSRALAREAENIFKKKSISVEFIDLRNTPLPFCDGETATQQENVKALKHKLNKANGILVACPIYNYSVNAVAKNLIELAGAAFEKKIVGFLCSAGGAGSYMAISSYMASIIFNFHSYIIPHFVYAVPDSFSPQKTIIDPRVIDRIKTIVDETIIMAEGLSA